MTINEAAAAWWAERFQIADQREAFRVALLAELTDDDWQTYSDYDPNQGPLLNAVRAVTPCKGFFCSSEGLLPTKTGLRRDGSRLYAKEGYGQPWEVVSQEPRT